jgi:ElaB/YqjD/DUF883 family membrane-anchored ribosome-binding protein
MLPNVREIERRLRLLEKQLERVGDSTSASAAEVAERAGAVMAPVLNRIADRIRGGAHSISDETTNLGNEVAKLGNNALRRLSNEVEHRPLLTLAVAVGVGILVGLASRSVAAGSPRAARRPPRRRAA